MDLRKFLFDLYVYCKNNDLNFNNLTIKEQNQHIKIMLKNIAHKSH